MTLSPSIQDSRVFQPSLTTLRAMLLLLISLLLGNALIEAQTTSTWTGGGGEWSPCPNAGGNALWDTCSLSTPQYPDGNYNAVIQGGPVTLNGTDGIEIVNLTLGSGSSLELVGGYVDLTGTSLVNNGTITIVSGNGLGLIGQGATVTLSGSGTVNMTTQNSYFHGTSGSSPILINQQTVMGQGVFGEEGLSIMNQGTINAVGGLLVVQTDATGITNTSLMQASNGATLQVIAPITNTGATLKALNGGILILEGSPVVGGTLTTVGTGVIQLTGDTILNGVTNSGKVEVSSNTGLLQNTVTNTGTIQLVSGTLFMAGTVTLTGSGSLLMSGSSLLEQNVSSVGPPGGSLINQQLIHGAGNIYDLPLTNQGTIRADNKSAILYLDTATTNTATLEATGGGTLEIYPGQTVKNTGGIIEALNGSTVLLAGTISGGTLKTSGTGVIENENGTLDGTVNIPTNAGMLSVPMSYDLILQGTVNNTGTIALGTNSCIVLNLPTTLTGSGKVTMGANSCIYGSGNGLTNQSTIEGMGTIGDSNPMPITNNGTILANGTAPLYIVPNSAGFTNHGKLLANAGSTLIIQTSVNNPFNNLPGTTLNGGTYDVTGTLELGGAITTNSASITLTGAAAEILDISSSANALSTLAANGVKGVLSLQNGQALVTTTGVKNAGIVTVGTGSAFTVGHAYTQTGGTTTVDGTLTAPKGINLQLGTLLGVGTIAGPITSAATITAGDSPTTAGLLTLQGSYTQESTGVLNVAIGGTTAGSQYSQVAVSHGISLGGTLNISLISSFTPAIGDTFTILTGGTVTGTFATVNGLGINSGEHFEINYKAKAVTLTVVSGA